MTITPTLPRNLRQPACIILALGLAATACCKDKSTSELPEPPPPSLQTPADLGRICRGEPAAIGATPYKKTAKMVSPVRVFEGEVTDITYKETGKTVSQFTGTVTETHPTELTPWESKEAKDTQLVACVKEHFVKSSSCEFSGKAQLDLMSSTVEVSIHDASNGQLLKRESYELPAPGCPWQYDFNSKSKRAMLTPSYSSEVAMLIASFQPPDALAPTLTRSMLRTVCEGRSIPGVEPYNKKDSHNPLQFFFAEGDDKTYRGDLDSKSLSAQKKKWDKGISDDKGDRNLNKVRLVACVRGKEGKQSKSCEFFGGKTLTINDANYEVVIREVLTGREVSSKTIPAPVGGCPTVHDFGQGSKILAEPPPELTNFLVSVAGQ